MTPSLFITGTDTGVGKTFIGCLLAESIRGAGKTVGVLKPFSAGDLDDAAALHRSAGRPGPVDRVTLLYSRLPLAPAAQVGLGRGGRTVVEKTFAKTLSAVKELQKQFDSVLVEGLGGVLAPLGGPYVVADLIARLRLPVWIVGRAGLGTLNHVLLTVEALRHRGLTPRRIILSGHTGHDLSEKTNARILEGLTGIPLTEIPRSNERAPLDKAKRKLWAAFKTDFPFGYEKK
ncbi:MAG: dethiobiotin synthase [Elusimicrobia bacterium]|nr:dethiobiotin synthase [Elusimicrobiota bacterium]